MRRKLVIVFSLFFTALAGQYNIEGKVIYNDEALEFATVILYNVEGAIIDSEITDDLGNFKVEGSSGSYDLEISFIGLNKFVRRIELTSSIKLDPIILTDNSNELETVTIQAKKRLIEQKPDRLIFNVAGNIGIKGGNAIDVMKLAPGLIVNRDGISMIGRSNARVLLNGRLLQLTGEELNDFISGLSAEDIEKLEIIANPPAQYEAAGNGGLINIVLKKGRANSWKNATTISYNQSFYDYYNVINQFFLNRDRLRLSFSINGSTGHLWENENLIVDFDEQIWSMDMNSKSNMERFAPKFLLDYDINNNWTAGIQYISNFAIPDFTSLAITEVDDIAGSETFNLINNSTRNRNTSNQSLNFHNNFKLDTSGRILSIDLDYFRYLNRFEQNIVVDKTTPENTFINKDLATENNSDQAITNFSANVNLKHPTKFIDLNYGFKYSTINTANAILSNNLISGQPLIDPQLTDQFDYQEGTSAFYISGSKNLSTRLSFHAGLRLENTSTQGISQTLSQVNINNYLKLFPTFFVSYTQSDQSNFTISYGRRINRPGFRDLNPFRIYVNDKSYSEGNPFLQPSFSDNLDFTHNYSGIFSTNFFFNYTTDGFGTVFSADPVTQEQATIRRNYFTNITMGLGERISIEPTSWWNSQNQIYFIQSNSNFKETVDGIEQNGLLIYLSSNHSFQLNKSSQARIDLWYRSSHRSNIFQVGRTYSANLSFSQSFLNDQLTFSVNINDVFDSASYRSLVSVVNGVSTTYGQNYSSRNLRLSVNYSFGNQSINVANRKVSNEEELSRSN